MSAMTDDDLREQTLNIVREGHILAVVSGDADMVEAGGTKRRTTWSIIAILVQV